MGSKLSQRPHRIERTIARQHLDECRWCNLQVIITVPRIFNAHRGKLNPSSDHWPDCFKEDGRCRHCGGEGRRINVVVPGLRRRHAQQT
jgi:hypothetical protein